MASNNLRYRENQPNTNNKREYNIINVGLNEWRIFMWFASLENAENYIYLFIVLWEDSPVRNNNDLKREFTEETADMIETINGIGIINTSTNYSKILNDYKISRINVDDASRQRLVSDAWVDLEKCGLKNRTLFESQLEGCSFDQRKELRKMTIKRLKSFREFARKIKEEKNSGKREMNGSLMNKQNECLNSQQAFIGTKNHENKILLEENAKLKNQVANLIKENSQHQVALGNIKNVSWNHDDPNNDQKLISNINELQDALSDFTMVQGNDFMIIDDTAKELLKEYGCEVEYPSTKAKLILGVILQRVAIKTILEVAQDYFYDRSSETSYSNNYDTTNLERDIVNTTESLVKYTELFRDEREGEDDVTKITPVKVRQHAYSALSCRGLPIEHPLIKTITKDLLNKMDYYRIVVDEETKSELNDQATQITRKVINIFCFWLKTQALEPTYKFFQAGQAIDMRLMQGSFGREDKKLEVEACGFPCIGIFEGDKSNHKVFTKANVIPKQR